MSSPLLRWMHFMPCCPLVPPNALAYLIAANLPIALSITRSSQPASRDIVSKHQTEGNPDQTHPDSYSWRNYWLSLTNPSGFSFPTRDINAVLSRFDLCSRYLSSDVLIIPILRYIQLNFCHRWWSCASVNGVEEAGAFSFVFSLCSQLFLLRCDLTSCLMSCSSAWK